MLKTPDWTLNTPTSVVLPSEDFTHLTHKSTSFTLPGYAAAGYTTRTERLHAAEDCHHTSIVPELQTVGLF